MRSITGLFGLGLALVVGAANGCGGSGGSNTAGAGGSGAAAGQGAGSGGAAGVPGVGGSGGVSGGAGQAGSGGSVGSGGAAGARGGSGGTSGAAGKTGSGGSAGDSGTTVGGCPDVQASCDLSASTVVPSKGCIDYSGTASATLSTLQTNCVNTNQGVWSTSPCDTSGSAGGCLVVGSGGCSIKWIPAAEVAGISPAMLQEECGAGTWVTP
jgi:hypothetical protein